MMCECMSWYIWHIWIPRYYYPNRSHLWFKMHLCRSHSYPEAVVIENCKNTDCITVWNRKRTENIVRKWAVQMSHPESFLLFSNIFHYATQTYPPNSSIMRLIMRFLCVSFIIHVPVKHWPSVKVIDWDKTLQNDTLPRPSLCKSILTEYHRFCFFLSGKRWSWWRKRRRPLALRSR